MDTSVGSRGNMGVPLPDRSAALANPRPLTLQAAGLIGILAACAVGVADVALLSTPGGDYGSGSYAYLRLIPEWRRTLGHFLGVCALPLELFGLWQVAQLIAPAGRWFARAFLLISIYSIVMGAAYHAALAPLGAAVAASEAGGDPARAAQLVIVMAGYARPFSTLTGTGVLLISAIFAWAVGFGTTGYPRWLALANPFTLLVFVIALGRILPSLGDLLLPTAFSVANAIFFGLSTLYAWQPSRLYSGAPDG